MDSSSVTDICILLVAPEATSRKTLMLLLDANYRVAIAYNAGDALSIIRKKKRKVDLVLTEAKLPDICAFTFVQMLKVEFGLPVGMLCEFHMPTIIRGLLNGAMYCLSKPITLHDVENLWQHPLVKEREVKEQSSVSSDTDEDDTEIEAENKKDKIEPCEFPVAIKTSQFKKRRIEGEGSSSMGPPPPFEWTQDVHCQFLRVIWDLGVSDATPLQLLCRINAPGLTMEVVTEKRQKYIEYSERQRELMLEKRSSSNNQIYQLGENINEGNNGVASDRGNRGKKEKTFFRWDIYPDPFPWAMDICMSSEAMLGIQPSVSNILQSPPRKPASDAVHKILPPWHITRNKVPPSTSAPPGFA